MSRIGKAPIAVPNGVTVTLKDDNVISVKGPKGELTRSLPAAMTVAQENGQVTVTRPSDEDAHKSLHGLTRTLIANMVEGVTKGFTKNLELVGVGYKAEVRPYGLQLALGYSHPIEYRAPQGAGDCRAPTSGRVSLAEAHHCATGGRRRVAHARDRHVREGGRRQEVG